ncbi:hypothetical protein HPB52_022960 [Rhipicephalus sanguineus]|uniref:Uncharacterized protein n=1 Tax=Rhipicephalus sanguineus TaxID=34632 RepID=A0A9D4SS26_RHISA|nr:hypothetical protein HPB52_022960 [Rhipicephalus sanguineus]
MPRAKSSIRTKEVVSALREAGLKLLMSDKEGGFVVMTSGTYAEKAGEAVKIQDVTLSSDDVFKAFRQVGPKKCLDQTGRATVWLGSC